MVKKVRVYVELSGGDIATVPDWVKRKKIWKILQMNMPTEISVWAMN